MAALQSYLQDADAILAEMQRAQPPRGIDQYLADADAILAESEQAVTPEAIQAVTGGEGIGGSLTRGLLRTAQAVSRPLAWMTGDTEKLNAEQQATRDAETSGLGTGIQEVTNLVAQMGLTAPLTAAVAAPLHATRLGRLAGASRTAAKAAGIGGKQLAARGLVNAADNAIQMGLQSGLESGAAAIPHGALLGATGGAVGGPIANPVARALAEGTVYAAGPAAVEGRAPTLEEGVYGYAFPVIQALAKVKQPSRNEIAKVLGVKPQELPPELQSAEGRARAVEDAKAYVAEPTSTEPRTPEQAQRAQRQALTREAVDQMRQSRDNQLFQPQNEEVIQRGEEVQGRQEQAPDEVLAQAPEQAVDTSTSTPPTPQRTQPLAPVTAAESPETTLVAPAPSPSIKPVEPENMPDWVSEEMQQRGLDPSRPLNDVDVANPSVRTAVESDPSLSAEQKQNILATGSPSTKTTSEIPTMQEVIASYRPIGGAKKPVAYEPAAQKTYDTYVSSLSPIQRAKSSAALERYVSNNGRSIPRHKLIEEKIANGWIIGERKGERILRSPEGDWIEESRISKTALDYASHLLDRKRVIDVPETDFGNKKPTLSAQEPSPVVEPIIDKLESSPTPEPEAPVAAKNTMNPADAHDFETWAKDKSTAELRQLRDDHESNPQEHSEHAVSIINKVISERSAESGLEMTIDTSRPAKNKGVKPVVEEAPVETPQAAPEPDLVSLKRASVDADREARGADEIPTPTQRSWEEVVEIGRKEIEANPNRPEEIMSAVERGELEIMTDRESAVLLAEKRRLVNQQNELYKRSYDESVPEFDRAIALEQAELMEGPRNRIDQISRAVGTEKGRSLAFQKVMMAQDYSLENMEIRWRAKKGAPLDKAERIELEHLVEEHKALLERTDTSIASRLLNDVFDAEVKSVTKKKPVSESFKTAMAESFKALHEIAGGERVGIVPTAFTPESYARAKPHLKKAWDAWKETGEGFTDFAREMAREFGMRIKPFMTKFAVDEKVDLAEMVKQHEAESASIVAMRQKVKKEGGKKPVDAAKQRETIEERMRAKMADEDSSVEDLRPLVQRLALNLIREKNPTREGLNDMVHDFMKQIVPDIKRGTVRNLYSGYGDVKLLDKEAAKVKSRQYKAENRQIEKIKDMMKGQAPKASGPERAKPQAEERRLTKIVNDLKRKAGFDVTDPETQLKSALDAVKTRLRNEIDDLDNAIADLRPLPEKRNKLQYDAEANDLRNQRNAKKAEYDLLFPKERKKATRAPLTDAQRLGMAVRSTDNAIARLQDQIKRGELYSKSRGLKPTSPELESKRAQLDALRAERDVLRDLDTATVESKKEDALVRAIARAKKGVERPAAVATADTQKVADLKRQLAEIQKKRRTETADLRALNAYKARMARKYADMQRRIAEDDFAPKKAEPKEVKKDADALALDFKISEIEKKFREKEFEFQMARRTPTEKALGFVSNRIDDIRTVKSSYDVSMIARQGVIPAFSHPILVKKALAAAKKAIRSEQAEFDIHQKLSKRKNAPIYKVARLFMHDATSTNLSSLEEAFRAKFARIIPGVKESSRIYATYLNVMRADYFDLLYNNLLKNNPMANTKRAQQLLGNFVNVTTGRGGGQSPKLDMAFNFFSAGLFSPRFVTSRIEYAIGRPLWTGILNDAFEYKRTKVLPKDMLSARMVIGKEYLRQYGTAAVLLVMLDTIPGVDVEYNPRSSSFGKVRLGDTTYDILGGINQIYSILTRSILGEKKTRSGKIKGLRGPEARKFGSETVGDELVEFGRYKFSPAAQTAADILTGQTAIGEPITPTESIITSPLPMSIDQAIEQLRKEGLLKGTVDSLIAATGVGVTTYD